MFSLKIDSTSRNMSL